MCPGQQFFDSTFPAMNWPTCFQIFLSFVWCGRCKHVSQLEISMIGLAVIAPVRQGFNRSRVRKRGWNRRDAEKLPFHAGHIVNSRS